jgi:polysaccharide pyruvyl transferase WcaK-like protein
MAFLADVGGASFHVGDVAMLEANLAGYRALHGDAPVRILGRDALDSTVLAERMAGSSGLWIAGGGNLSASWPELFDQRMAAIAWAHERNLPVILTGQTFGPDLTGPQKRDLARALCAAAYVGARELPSLALASALGVPGTRLWYQPDDAYLCEPSAASADRSAGQPANDCLAVTLDASFAAGSAGMSSLAAQIAEFALEQSWRVRFVPHLGPRDVVGDEDGASGRALAELLAKQGVDCEVLPVASVGETVRLTHGARLVLSSRYHPLVFASAGGVPCLGIHRDAYTRIKIEGALAHAGADDWALSFDAAADGALATRLADLEACRHEFRRRLLAHRARIEATEPARWRALGAALETVANARRTPRKPWFGGRFGFPRRTASPHVNEGEARWQGASSDLVAARSLVALANAFASRQDELGRERGRTSHLERLMALSPVAVATPRRKLDRSAGQANPEEDTMATRSLTDAQWNDYARDGFLHLGRLLDDEAIASLKERADQLALGKLHNPHVVMQLDTGGDYGQLPAAVAHFDRPTLLYRKIQGLETDDLFAGLVGHATCREVCATVYGAHAPISIFRAMVMNKPAGQGTELPWHQDGGEVWKLDRDPLVTIWVALDPATRANGCMEVIPGTHRLGLLTTHGSTVSDADVAVHCPPDRVHALEVEAGHGVLLHNWLIHRSGVNPSPVPRRAMTACYMDGRTRSTLTGNTFPMVWGDVAPEPHAYVRQLQLDCDFLRNAHRESSAWAMGLKGELDRVAGLMHALQARVDELEAVGAKPGS